MSIGSGPHKQLVPSAGPKSSDKNIFMKLGNAVLGTVQAVVSLPIWWVGAAFAAVSGVAAGLGLKKVTVVNDSDAEDSKTPDVIQRMKIAASGTLNYFAQPLNAGLDRVLDSFYKGAVGQSVENDSEAGVLDASDDPDDIVIQYINVPPQEKVSFQDLPGKLFDSEGLLVPTPDHLQAIEFDPAQTQIYDSSKVYKCHKKLTCSNGTKEVALDVVAFVKEGNGVQPLQEPRAVFRGGLIFTEVEVEHQGSSYTIPFVVNINGKTGHQFAHFAKEHLTKIFEDELKKALADPTVGIEQAVELAEKEAYEALFFDKKGAETSFPILPPKKMKEVKYNLNEDPKISDVRQRKGLVMTMLRSNYASAMNAIRNGKDYSEQKSLFDNGGTVYHGLMSKHIKAQESLIEAQESLSEIAKPLQIKIVRDFFIKLKASPIEVHFKIRREEEISSEDIAQANKFVKEQMNYQDKKINIGSQTFDLSNKSEALKLNQIYADCTEELGDRIPNTLDVTMSAFVMVNDSVKCISFNQGENLAIKPSRSNQEAFKAIHGKLEEREEGRVSYARSKVVDFNEGADLLSASEGYKALLGVPNWYNGYNFENQQQLDQNENMQKLDTQQYAETLMRANYLRSGGGPPDDTAIIIVHYPRPTEQRDAGNRLDDEK